MLIKKLTHNLGLKILAVFVAFGLWLIVINYADPVDKVSYSGIRVELLNTDSLTGVGKVYEVLNDSDTVNVTIYGKRSYLENISQENIHAVADLENITIMNTVAIEVYSNKNNSEIDSIKQSRASVELEVENLKEIPLTVLVTTTGEPAEGYVQGDVTQNQNTVRVSGPESVVNRITRAACNVSVAGRTSDLSTSADIRLLDTDGRVVTHDNLKTNVSTINVGVEILPTKDIPVVYSISGEPEDGYVVTGEPVADHNEIKIAGRSSVLSSISQLIVPASEISVEGAEGPVSRQLDLTDYLPDGARLVNSEEDGFDGLVSVNVDVEELIYKYFNVPIKNLRATGVPEDYEAEILIQKEEGDDDDYRPTYLKVEVFGIKDDMQDLTAASIKGVVDVESYLDAHNQGKPKEGTFRMELELELPEGIEVSENYHVDVRLTPETE
ncbi:MAG: hypothetical protein J6X66_14665 [Lachnospiraceae bacterium]|nr:hypothetical protein [Lachnospiraceae bacterium]